MNLTWDPPLSVRYSPSLPDLTLTFLRGPQQVDRLFFTESVSRNAHRHLYFETQDGLLSLSAPDPERFREFAEVSLHGPYWESVYPDLLDVLGKSELTGRPWPEVFARAKEAQLWHLIDVFCMGCTLPGPKTDSSTRIRRTSFVHDDTFRGGIATST